MSGSQGPMTAADEARAWIERLIRNADKYNAQNEAAPVPEENCPPTHFSTTIRLKPLPDGRVSVYEPGVEVTPDRLRAFLVEHDKQRDRAEKAEAEMARLRAQMAAEPAPFRFPELSAEELAAAEEAFMAAWSEPTGKPIQILEPAHTFVSQWSVRYLEDGMVTEKYHTEAEARQRAKANPRTLELVTRLVEDKWRTVGDDNV